VIFLFVFPPHYSHLATMAQCEDAGSVTPVDFIQLQEYMECKHQPQPNKLYSSYYRGWILVSHVSTALSKMSSPGSLITCMTHLYSLQVTLNKSFLNGYIVVSTDKAVDVGVI